VLRWASLAAAAVVVIGACGLYLAATNESFAPLARMIGFSGDTLPEQRQEIGRLRKQAADWQTRGEAAEKQAAELADLPRKLADLQARFDANSASHAETVRKIAADAKARQAEAALLGQAKADLETKLHAADEKLAAAAQDAKALAETAAEVTKARADLAAVRTRLTAAAAELQRVHTQQQKAESESVTARQQVAAIQARHAEVVAAFQRTYLASTAPGEQGLQARKTAARVRHMIDRCAALSAASGDQSTRALLARLEAVLTRLDLLNPDRPGAGEGFWKLIGRDELQRQIDQALSAGGQSQDVRNWLFEAKLILSGENNAG
jgi:chromosome segregation protein